jgi:hypothetical protein
MFHLSSWVDRYTVCENQLNTLSYFWYKVCMKVPQLLPHSRHSGCFNYFSLFQLNWSVVDRCLWKSFELLTIISQEILLYFNSSVAPVKRFSNYLWGFHHLSLVQLNWAAYYWWRLSGETFSVGGEFIWKLPGYSTKFEVENVLRFVEVSSSFTTRVEITRFTVCGNWLIDWKVIIDILLREKSPVALLESILKSLQSFQRLPLFELNRW